MYCGTGSATGVTTTAQKWASPAKNARGPLKVRQSTPQSSRCMPRAMGRDLASIEVLKLFLACRGNLRADDRQVGPGPPILYCISIGKASFLENQISTTRKFSVYCFESDAKSVSRPQLKLALVLWLETCSEMIAGWPGALLAGLARFWTASRTFGRSSRR